MAGKYRVHIVLGIVALVTTLWVLYGALYRDKQAHQSSDLNGDTPEVSVSSFPPNQPGMPIREPAGPPRQPEMQSPRPTGKQVELGGNPSHSQTAKTPTEAENAGLEALGACLRKCLTGSVPDSPPEEAYRRWPDMAGLLDLYVAKCKQAPVKPRNIEEEIVYRFFFSDEKTSRQSLKMFGRSLCLTRMDEVWPHLRPDPKNIPMPVFGKCPVSGLHYRASSEQLTCPNHGTQMSFPHRTVTNCPPEVYSQLLQGYYNHNRTHRLDAIIIDDRVAGTKAGEKVVDVGCGVGCYTGAMAQAAGSTGQVLALDIDNSVLEFVAFAAKYKGQTNIVTVPSERYEPKLEASSVDRMYIIDVLNVIIGVELDVQGKATQRNIEYLRKLVNTIKPGGHLVIVDFAPSDNRPHVSQQQATTLFASMGLELEQGRSLMVADSPMYVLTFKK